MIQSYQDLEVWQVSMDLVEAVYRLTQLFPDEEKFALTTQLRRAAVSIPSNIAEGHGRSHRGDYLRHLSFARGSAKELETQLLISQRLGFVTQEQMSQPWCLAQRVGQMITRLKQALERFQSRCSVVARPWSAATGAASTGPWHPQIGSLHLD